MATAHATVGLELVYQRQTVGEPERRKALVVDVLLHARHQGAQPVGMADDEAVGAYSRVIFGVISGNLEPAWPTTRHLKPSSSAGSSSFSQNGRTRETQSAIDSVRGTSSSRSGSPARPGSD